VTYSALSLDDQVWAWVKSLLTDPDKLAKGLGKQQTTQGNLLAPIRARLDAAEDMLAQHQIQLDRLLDLYLSGEFPKDALIERKIRLESTLNELKKEPAVLAARFTQPELTEQRLRTIKQFATGIFQRSDGADDNFLRRHCTHRINELVITQGSYPSQIALRGLSSGTKTLHD